MIDICKNIGYSDPDYPKLDPTTPHYEFNSYMECCRSLEVIPSVQKFMTYQKYFKTYGSK